MRRADGQLDKAMSHASGSDLVSHSKGFLPLQHGVRVVTSKTRCTKQRTWVCRVDIAICDVGWLGNGTPNFEPKTQAPAHVLGDKA
jgi:hypothetical protein